MFASNQGILIENSLFAKSIIYVFGGSLKNVDNALFLLQ